MENKNPIKEWLRREGRLSYWLADQVGVNAATLSLWTTGKMIPLPHNRDALKRICDIDQSYWVEK